MTLKIETSILKKIRSPELTTAMLLGVLSNYSDPRKKIHSLVNSGFIKPIKQGVYLVSDEIGLRPYSKEILANLIYGPSYISLESALSYYGLIPEAVTTTTSICIGKSRKFSTPVGEFEYHHLKDSIYSNGVHLKEVFKDAFCQFGSPEKSLLDFIHIREKNTGFKNSKEYFSYILDSYRFDSLVLRKKISTTKIRELSNYYPFQNVSWFVTELLRKR